MLQYSIPVLHMTNADATEAFYCGQLGFQLAFQVPSSATTRDPCYMVLTRDTAYFHISSHAGDGVSGGVIMIATDDVDQLHEEFLSRKVPIHLGPVDQSWGMRELYVIDPDGNSVRFSAPVAAA